MVFYGSLGERSRLRCRQPSYATGLFETLWGRTSHQFDGDGLTTNGVGNADIWKKALEQRQLHLLHLSEAGNAHPQQAEGASRRELGGQQPPRGIGNGGLRNLFDLRKSTIGRDRPKRLCGDIDGPKAPVVDLGAVLFCVTRANLYYEL